ncbi:MAG: hypothetical protein C4301_05675 [Thermus sp.]
MPRRLSTARQALRVLAYLLTHPEGVVAQEVAQILGKSLTTAYALLNSLVDEGFAKKTERGYRPRIFPQEKGTDLGEALEELYLRTRERSYLVLLDPQGPVLLTRGRQGQPHPLGETLPKEWHALALGSRYAFAGYPQSVSGSRRYVGNLAAGASRGRLCLAGLGLEAR